MASRRRKVKRFWWPVPAQLVSATAQPDHLDNSPRIRENRRDHGKWDHRDTLINISIVSQREGTDQC